MSEIRQRVVPPEAAMKRPPSLVGQQAPDLPRCIRTWGSLSTKRIDLSNQEDLRGTLCRPTHLPPNPDPRRACGVNRMEGSSPSRTHGTRTEPLILRSLPHRAEKGPVVPPTDPPTTPPRPVRGAAASSEGQGSPESGSSSGGSRNTSPTKKYKQPYIQPRVGRMFQVSEWNLPDMYAPDRRGAAVRSASRRPSIEKERPMMWKPGVVSDKLVEAFVEAVGKLEGCTMNGDAWDEGYKTLFRTRGNVQAALETVRELTEEREWTAEEKHIFLENIRYRDKEFAKIKVRGRRGWGK